MTNSPTVAIRKPDRTIKARAAAKISRRDQALSAYAVVTPLALQMRADGMTFAQIAAALNTARLKTRKGAAFMPSTVGRILDRATSIPAQ